MSGILIENITRKMLVESWDLRKSESINLRVLDKIMLKVPIILKRKETNVIVNSKIVLTESKNGVRIEILSNFTKIIIFSLLIGILPSLLFLLLFSNLTLFIIFSVLISTLIFRMYYLNTQKVIGKYLNKIKENYFQN